MKKSLFALSIAAALLVPPIAGAQDKQPQSTAEYRAQVAKESPDTMARFRKLDPGIEKFFKDSAGYAVFPRVGKAGFIIGGGHGGGEVFEKGKVVGYTTITTASIGLQAGVQEFSEIIFFQNQAALDRYKQGKFEVTANVSAIILKAGAAAATNYRDGVVVFVHSTAGAMAEASVGTQKFSYTADGGAAKK